MSDHTLKRLTKKFFSPKGSANRLKTTDSEGRLGRKHARGESMCKPFHIALDMKTDSYRSRYVNLFILHTIHIESELIYSYGIK